MNRIVNPPELPKPSGFSHAVVAGNTVYLAGQVGSGETLVEQFDGAARNLVTALRAAGGEVDDLVSLQVFVTDVAAYRAALSELGQVWRKHFGSQYPAMGVFGVTELFDPGLQVELMGVAVIAAVSDLVRREPAGWRPPSCAPIAERGRPVPRQPTAGRGAGRARAAGAAVPRGVGHRPVPDPRGARDRMHRGRDRVRAAGARRLPDPPGRLGGAARALDPARGRRQRGGRVRADRARRRLGRVGARRCGPTPDGDGYRLTGEKVWISNAPEADIYTVFARTSEGSRGLTAFAVPGDSQGLTGEHKQLVAPHAIGSLRFDDVFVPADHVLGEVGARLPGGDADARPVPPERRRVRGRDGHPGARARRRPGARAPDVRQAAGTAPGGRATGSPT